MTSFVNRLQGVAKEEPVDLTRMPRGWRLVLIVGGLSIFGPLCIDMYLPALPRISGDLHASTSAVQLSVTGCLIGIGVGQLLIGPISDRKGRRGPLFLGLGLFILSSLACSAASSVYLLDAGRFVQGVGGAAGIVISRAIVRDLFEGPAAARFFSTLMLVTGLGPIIAPQIGAVILRFTTWRGIFLALAIAGSVLLAVAVMKVPETLPVERRHSGGMRSIVGTMAEVGRDRIFVGYAVVATLGFGAIMAYVSGSTFILQGIYGISPQLFGAIFGLNAAGMVVGAQINGHFVHRLGSGPLLTVGLVFMSSGSALFLTAVSTNWGGLGVILPSLFILLFGLGFVGPNAMALALQNHPNSAGAASALLGTGQFLFAAGLAPLAGIGGSHDALPMGILMVVLAGGATAIRATLLRADRKETAKDKERDESLVSLDSTPLSGL
jgi:DHA1 family bicyclomycin/chloramphenicol resistance-like MFS transporter